MANTTTWLTTSESMAVSTFFYEDSGTDGLDPSNYTTMVFIHGIGFNGGEGMLQVVPGPKEEAALFMSSDLEDGKRFLRLAGLQIARFLLEFAAVQGIPKYNKEKKRGGIVLNGLSLGTLYSQAVLSALDSLTTEELGQLETYLHAIL
ncbi:hypothetical protein F5141DRAFT_1060372 [Pisolithus sp. B1]|nr:hypothetical protein F5141DRAFT_1060372 [Pisolithus sp. B1]